MSFVDQQDALLLRATVSTTTCDMVKLSAHGFSGATLPPSVPQLTTGELHGCQSFAGASALKQMCFQDKNNTVSCKSPSASLFACTRQTVCLGMACVGTYRLR